MVQTSKIPFQRDSVDSLPLLNELFIWPDFEPYKGPIEILSNGKNEKEEIVTRVVRKSSSQKSNSDVDLDLTGSPLKASFTLDEDDEEDLEIVSLVKTSQGLSFRPLETRFARKLISDEDKSQDFSIFAFCNNDNRTLILGSSKNSHHGLTMFKVENEGLVSSKYSELFLKDKSFARAIYDITKRVETDSEDETSTLKLRFNWARPQNLLEPPPGYANVELLVKLSNSVCPEMSQELELLKGFKLGLENQGIQWLEREDENFDLMDELRKFLIKVKQDGPRSLVKNAKMNETVEEITSLNPREDLDLTDLLWNVLKKVESFQELKIAFECFFQAFKREEIRPYINARNDTKVAKAVLQILKNPESSPNLTQDPLDILEMLLEIGVEKLKRDCTFTLLNHLLATRDDLEKILCGENDLKVLEKLHFLQCLISLSQTFLAPDQACLRSIVQQAIKLLNSQDEIPKDFALKICRTHVKDQISTLCPSIWQCHFSSKCGKRTTLHLSVEPPSDLVEIQQEKLSKSVLEEDEELEKIQYYVLKATSISRPDF